MGPHNARGRVATEDGVGASLTVFLGRDAMEAIKRQQKEGLPEDLAKDAEQQVQHVIDGYIKKVDKHLEIKEGEIMTV